MTKETKTTQALVVAARELFAERGYEGASIRAITQRAGANLGAVSYHFGSKEALYEACFASIADPFREHLLGVAGQPAHHWTASSGWSGPSSTICAAIRNCRR